MPHHPASTTNTNNVTLPYRLGLPIWAYPKWKGVYFDDSRSMLNSYASVFNAVEGNTSFYGVPGAKSIDAWCQALANTDCTINFKLPSRVTHAPVPDKEEFKRFLTAMQPMAAAAHLGPLLVQFPETAGPAELDRFEPFFAHLAKTHRCVVEVRHPVFFAEPERLEALLERYGFGRVMLDTRAIYNGDLTHPDVVNAAHRKPNVPLLNTVYNQLAFARVVLHPDNTSNDRWIDDWTERAARMIENGDETTVIIHCPENFHCTDQARTFHERLRTRLSSIPELPPWPVPQQGSLF